MNPTLIVLAALWAAGGVDPGPAAVQPTVRGGGVAAAHAAEGAPVLPVFRATGVCDGSTAATVVHCTNLGSATRTVYVDIWDFDAAFDCGMSTSVAPGETRTLTTRATSFFFDDAACASPPGTVQGSLLISLSGWTRLICTVQIVDPAAATPKFAERLDLFDRNGIPLPYVIFADGFESSSTSEWSPLPV